ncbi:MAG TPA: glycosyltransferase [Dongiaceae bacterium]|nr:glycosyltransferase [Dongiaceae bacterium]
MQVADWDLVSVIIPVFNAEAHLEETLASVLGQTYPHIEIVAVDDGSTDRSLEILEKYRHRIRVVRQKNGGAAAARNRGAQEARGKWIAFLDADDLWAPDKVERQLGACADFTWSYTDSVFMGGVNDGRRDSELTPKYQGRVLEQLICNNFVGTSSVMIQRQVFLDAGGFSESLRSIEDWEFWIRLASDHNIGYIEEPLVRYRIHSSSSSRSTRSTLPYHMKVIDQVFSEGGPAERLVHLKPSAKAQSYGICSQIAEEEGDYLFALRCAVLACHQLPLAISRWERVVKSFIKYLVSLFGVKVVQQSWWLGAIVAFEPVVPL